MEVPAAVFQFHWQQESNNPGMYSAQAEFVANSSHGVAFTANGLDLRGQLPALEPNSFDSSNAPEVSATYVIPSSDGYDWVGVPDFTGLGPIGVSFTRSTGTVDSPSPFRASNPVEQQSESNATFVAGALIGVAGGALVSAGQEAISLIKDRRRSVAASE
jgi:hypothetical protein